MNKLKHTEEDEKYFKLMKKNHLGNLITMNQEMLIYAKSKGKIVIYDFITHEEFDI